MILINIEPPKEQKTTKETAKTFGDWAYIALDKHYHKIGKYEKLVLQDKDPEDLHQMRVGMRRLRSAIVGFSSALTLPKNANERKVGKVARVLGELRDLDVLQHTLENHYYPNLPAKEQTLLKLALDFLKKERKKALKKVKAILTDKYYQYLKNGFEKWLENPSYTPVGELDIYTILPDLLLPQISQLLLHQGWLVGYSFSQGNNNWLDNDQNHLTPVEVESFLNTQGISLHDLRKVAKKNRYNMELFTQFYGETYQQYLKQIKEIQGVLGDMQDSFVLGEFLFRVLDFNVQKKMPTLTKILTETRWQKWQDWQQLQQVFLDKENRREFHEVILHPINLSEPLAQ
ncbi:MAG: CHAD domain-containing protein [Microcystaceae cyanobacterium]